MLKTIRYVLLILGLVIAVYGAWKDIDPLTIIGALIFVIALMMNMIIRSLRH